MKNNFIALINDSRQYSPDSWEECPRIMDIDENTTVGDLIRWHNTEFKQRKWDKKSGQNEFVDPSFFNQIKIIRKSDNKQ